MSFTKNTISHPLYVRRTHPFNPTKFLGKGWSIDEQDERSLALTRIDLSTTVLENVLKTGETEITGEERLLRLKSTNNVLLDAKVLQSIVNLGNSSYNMGATVPKNWQVATKRKPLAIYFYGTILRNPEGCRRVLYLLHDDMYGWTWFNNPMDHDLPTNSPAVVLPL